MQAGGGYPKDDSPSEQRPEPAWSAAGDPAFLRTATEQARKMRQQRIRERVLADRYEVDPAAVAAAIVERLLANRAGRGHGRRDG